VGRLILLVLLSVLIAGGVNWLLGRHEPVGGWEESGTAAPGKKMPLLAVAGGAFMALASASLFVLDGKGWSAAFLTLIGILCAALTTFPLTKRYVVRWDASSISGPTGWFGPTGRTTIRWSDVIKAGETSPGHLFLEARDGRRVCWTDGYKGYDELVYAVETRCRHVRLPLDEA
jgi:hypothetical protein